jgi:protease I
MNIQGKKIAILVDNYFEQAEFEVPLKALKEAGGDVTVITTNDDLSLQGLNHVEMGDKFKADKKIDEANPDDYDALVLPGGAVNADSLRMVDKAKEWVTDFMDDNKPLAAICHAPWLLASADVIEGHRLTSFFTIQDDLKNAGAEWVDLNVVVDNNLITSRKPDDLKQFNEAIISMLNQQPASINS